MKRPDQPLPARVKSNEAKPQTGDTNPHPDSLSIEDRAFAIDHRRTLSIIQVQQDHWVRSPAIDRSPHAG
jgi:hypothetical protein